MATNLEPSPARLTFRREVAEFWRFLRRPTLRRVPGRRVGGSVSSDWLPGLRDLRRVLAWAVLLWLVNVCALGPIAVLAADAGGAAHRLDPEHIPVLMAVLWAPFAEEMLFRYGLRRPLQALWVVPVMTVLVLRGPGDWFAAALASAGLLAVLGWSMRRGRAEAPRWRCGWRREYCRRYGVVFHLAALIFAAVHLHNFVFNGTAAWMLPLLVLPQWITGLVLGWLRSTRGIGASMALHAIYNGGPVLAILLAMKWLPGIDV
jgi:membrane protease YdiL (CAAX protease family)